MKRIKNKISLILTLAMLFSFIYVPTSYADDGKSSENQMKGLWVATVLNIDYPKKPTTDSEVLKKEAIEILDKSKKAGINSIFLQIRPSSDALYKSEYFPMSKYLTGKQGLQPDNGFDPLQFWIEEAHKRNIKLHGWINPYRITKKTASESKFDYDSLDPSNQAILHKDWVIEHKDGNLYFDPGNPDVRQMIVDSTLEIIRNYNIDGIHFDDYFYPDRDFEDDATYAKYGKSYSSVGDFRRASVDSLIADLSNAIDKVDPTVEFGISPFGIWANKSSNKLGSDTNGMQSYYDHYADTRKWVKDGTIDYIAPQIYWNIGFKVADYSTLVKWWSDVVSGTDVKLYVGHAAYRVGNTDKSSPWYGVNEIRRQLALNETMPEVDGSIFFKYTTLKTNSEFAKLLADYYTGTKPVSNNMSVSIDRPTSDIKTYYDKYYIAGVYDPSKVLYLNSEPVDFVGGNMFYGMLVPLKVGKNTIKVSQDGSSDTLVITRLSGGGSSGALKTAAIDTASLYPKSDIYKAPGESITFTCKAPIGSKMTVSVGGKSYEMTPKTKSSKGKGIYNTTYSYTYKIGTPSNNSKVVDYGKPNYSMKYKGKTTSESAKGAFKVIPKDAALAAKVVPNVIDSYKSATSSNGSAFELYSGMIDRITGKTETYTRLSSGLWVKNAEVEEFNLKSKANMSIDKVVLNTQNTPEKIVFYTNSSNLAYADYSGKTVDVTITNAIGNSNPNVDGSNLVKSSIITNDSDKTTYSFTLKDNKKLEGYYLSKYDDRIELVLKEKKASGNSSLPLDGKTIMLDPGHGNEDSGAIGPLGLYYSEKHINLATALRLKDELEKLGAEVLLTRATDIKIPLKDVLGTSRQQRPDMFISLHANSMADNVDISKIDGFSVYFREEIARDLATTIHKNVITNLGRTDKGIHKNNFYVNRGTWAPSILIETGFVPNPIEFEWLIDNDKQKEFAKNIADSIVEYYYN